jgi:septal ring factor EnvC (AmiA/AmiB activator)
MFAQSLPLILTLLAIGAGIFFNNKGLADLKADIKADIASLKADTKSDIARLDARFNSVDTRFNSIDTRFNSIDTRLNAIQSELLRFSELKGHLEGRIDEIARRVAA